MYSPYDEGLSYPLEFKVDHGNHFICDSFGKPLIRLDVIRPSIEARIWLKEWGEEICKKFNNSYLSIVKNTNELSVNKDNFSVEPEKKEPNKIEDSKIQGANSNLIPKSIKELLKKR